MRATLSLFVFLLFLLSIRAQNVKDYTISPEWAEDGIRPPIFPGCERLIKSTKFEITDCFQKSLNQKIMKKVSKSDVINQKLFGEAHFRFTVDENGQIANVLAYGSENLKEYLETIFDDVRNEINTNGEIQPAINLETGTPITMILITGIKIRNRS